MRKALIVGIDHYDVLSRLYGCVNDAYSVKGVLERHSDSTTNFKVKTLMGTGADQKVTRSDLRNNIRELFSDDSEIALFYYAGHGYADAVGGYLCPSDCEQGEDGLTLAEVMVIANQSSAKNKIIILDSCQSGIVGNNPLNPGVAELSHGMTVLTASTDKQYAQEQDGSGIFTNLLVDALSGAAANLVGAVTPGSVYAHIDQSLGAWEQRPVFKTNVKNFVSLRQVQPPIELKNLHRLLEFFPTSGEVFKLDPSYEPERGTPAPTGDVPPPNPVNTEKFAVLQKLVRVNLVVPVDAPHMYHAAMESKACRLTVLGEHYRALVEREQI